MHTRMTPFVLFTPPWRLSPELRRFRGQLPWLVEWVFARARLLSVKLEIVVRGRWTRWERRRILPRVYRPLPLPTRYSSRNRRGVSYRQLLTFGTSASRNSKVSLNLFTCTAWSRRKIPLAASRPRMRALLRRSLDAQAN